MHELIKSLEEKLLNPSVRKSFQELNELLADDFIEHGSSGKVYSKHQVIEALQKEFPFEGSISEFNTVNLTDEIVLATYTAEQTNKTDNIVKCSLRSSIWRKNNKKWQIVFHQGTPLNKV